MNTTEFKALERDVCGKNPLVHASPRTRRRAFRLAMSTLYDTPDSKADFAKEVRARYQAKYGNPMIFLWILGIVINLVWQWWLSRKSAVGLAAADTIAWDIMNCVLSMEPAE